MLSLVHDADVDTDAARDGREPAAPNDLDELCRLAAREMLAVALEAERRAYLAAHAEARDEDGRRLVVGNGHRRPREITTAAGRVEVTAPRVDDRRDGHQFTSAILPPYMRRSPKVTEVLPVLYLRGLSTNDFVPALEGFFGSAAGLSPSTIARLTEAWRVEHARWCQRDLSAVDYVYIWADGVYVNVRLPDTDGAQDRLCLLVIVGVRPDGTKQLVAAADGHREDTQSWADLLRDLRDRGMTAPTVAVGDGALGFWAALGQVFGSTRVQRCWVHKVANVLAALPKRLHGDAKAALAAIYIAETRAAAVDAAHEFASDFAAHPKAVAKITADLDVLLTFFDFPVEHHKHLRTTNVIESTFATVRLRQRTTTKGRAAATPASRWPTSCWMPPRHGGGGSTATNSSHSSEPARPSSTDSYKNGMTPTLTLPDSRDAASTRPQQLTIAREIALSRVDGSDERIVHLDVGRDDLPLSLQEAFDPPGFEPLRVRARGPLGSSLRRDFRVVPGLRIITSTPPIRSLTDDGLSPTRVEFHGVDVAPLVLEPRERRARVDHPRFGSVLVSPPSIGVLHARSGSGATWRTSPLSLDIDKLADDPGYLLVRIPGDDGAVRLCLHAAGQIVQQLDPAGRARADGTRTFDLRRALDTIRHHGAGVLAVESSTYSGRVAVVKPSSLATGVYALGGGGVLQFTGVAAADIEAAVWLRLAPLSLDPPSAERFG